MRKQNSRTHRVSTKVMTWVLTFVMLLGLIPYGAIQVASAAELLKQDDLQAVGTELWKEVVENGYTQFDTIDMCGGNSHLQGICMDDEGKYLYFSYTSSLAKLDMSTGKVVASVGGFGQGSFGTPGGAHLGCLDYYDGWIYGSLEYKEPGKKFFIAAFDASKLTKTGMDIKGEDFKDGGVTGILLYEPTEDFRDPIDTNVFSGQDSYGHATNEANNGHAFACSGIDGVTFGTMPGDTSGKLYLIVAYGVYGFSNINRYDNTYNVLQFYDVEDFWDGEKPVGTQNIRFTYERGLAVDYTQEEVLKAADTLFVYTGNTSYGAQNLEYEADTGDIVLYTYGNTDGMGGTKYVVDGSKAPVEKVLELGQSNTLSDATQKAYAKSIADAYSTDANGNGTIEDSERLTGKVAVLKCICGNADAHSAASVGDATWSTTGVKKADQPICSGSAPMSSTTGIAWVGNDGDNVDYLFIANGSTTAGLYKRTTNANGSWSYEKVTVPVTKKPIVQLSMDAADMYEKDGVVYMKNKAEGYTDGTYDAIVENTSASKGEDGKDNGALHFDGGWDATSELDRLYLNSDTINVINQKIQASSGNGSYSYSFWAKLPDELNSDGNFVPFVGFYREDGTYAGVFEIRWRNMLKYVINGIGDRTVGDPGDNGAYYVNGATPVPNDGEWHMFTVTEAAGSGTLYMDGVVKATYSVTSNHLAGKPFAEFEVGGTVAKLWLDGNNRGRFIGDIDDISIYSGILTQAEIQAAYAAGTKTGDGTAYVPAAPEQDSNLYATYTKGGSNAVTVTADKNVQTVTGVGPIPTVSGKVVTFSNDVLSAAAAGRYDKTINYADGTTGTLVLTVLDPANPVLSYSLLKKDLQNGMVGDGSAYGVSAITTVTEYSGGAFFFNGFDYNDPTYVKLSDADNNWLNNVLSTNGAGFTLNVWAKAADENGNKTSILGLYAEDGRPMGVLETYDGEDSDAAAADNKTTIQADIGTAAKASQNVRSTSQTNVGDYYMYTLTYDAATKTLTLYVDGVAQGSKVVDANDLDELDELYIGTQYKKFYHNDMAALSTYPNASQEDWTTRGGFYGEMRNFSLYAKPLEAAEIKALADMGAVTPITQIKPIVQYTMDGNTLNGDGTVDEAISGYTSYFRNVTSVAGVDGKANGALYFDGRADAANWSRLWLGEDGIDAVNDAISTQVTISFWIKPDGDLNNAFSNAWSPALGFYSLTKTNAGNNLHNMVLTLEERYGVLNMEMNNYPNGTWPTDIRLVGPKTDVILDGDWHHIVMSVDMETSDGNKTGGASMWRRLYIDGVEYTPDRALYPTTTILDTIDAFEIGGEPWKCWSDTNVRGRFTGAIDDVRIYNVPVSKSDVQKLMAAGTVTGSDLTLSGFDFTVDVANEQDVTFNAANTTQLVSVSGLEDDDVSFAGGVVTLDGAALADLGLGAHDLLVVFDNGSKTIRVTVVDTREYFTPSTIVFDKNAAADVEITCKAAFGTPKTVVAEGLTEDDYSISGNKIILKKEWLLLNQPGAVELTVTSADGNTKVAKVYVVNYAPVATVPSGEVPYPVLYYKLDKADLNKTGTTKDGQSDLGTITDHSGNGIDLQYASLNTAGKDNAGNADAAIFFDGYNDGNVSRAWLDEAGMDFLKSVVDDEMTISFWHSSEWISSNYMTVGGVFAADDRPLLVSQFNTTGGERSGKNQNTAPAVISATGNATAQLTTGVAKAGNVAMNGTWHQYTVVYDAGAVTLYVDGVEKATGTAAADQLDAMAAFEIGGLVNNSYFALAKSEQTQNSPNRLYGYMDELKVYNVALTADDVKDVYDMGVGNDLPGDLTGLPTNITDETGFAVLENEGAYAIGYVESPEGPVEGAVFSYPEEEVIVTLPEGMDVNDGVAIVVLDTNGDPTTELPINIADSENGSRTGEVTNDDGAVAYLIPAEKLLANAVGVEKTYDGEASAPSVTALMGAVIEYSTDDGATWSTEAPAYTDVVEATVKWRVTKDWYETAEGEVEVVITEASIEDFEIEANDSVVYDGEAHVSATVVVGIPADATITYTCGSDEYDEVPSFTDAGSYTVTYVIEKENYEPVEGSYTFVIEYAEIEADYELIEKAEATGEPVPAAKINSISEGAYPWFAQFKDKATMEAYKADPESVEDPFEKIFDPGEIPAFTEPGVYYLVVYFEGENYMWTDLEFYTFELTEPAPETGDNAALGLWMVMLTLSAAAGAILVLRRRKEQA